MIHPGCLARLCILHLISSSPNPCTNRLDAVLQRQQRQLLTTGVIGRLRTGGVAYVGPPLLATLISAALIQVGLFA